MAKTILIFLVIFVALGLITMMLALAMVQAIKEGVIKIREWLFIRKKRKGDLKQQGSSTLTKEDFDRILIEEGILSEENRDEVWRGRSLDWNKAGDEATEMCLRKSAKAYLKEYPESAKEDLPVNDSE